MPGTGSSGSMCTAGSPEGGIVSNVSITGSPSSRIGCISSAPSDSGPA